MKRIILSAVLLLVFTLGTDAQTLVSPNKLLSVNFYVDANGVPTYTMNYKSNSVIKPSTLGLELTENRKEGFWKHDNADYKTNPQAYTIKRYIVDSKSHLKQSSVLGGGYAISIFPVKDKQNIAYLKKLYNM